MSNYDNSVSDGIEKTIGLLEAEEFFCGRRKQLESLRRALRVVQCAENIASMGVPHDEMFQKKMLEDVIYAIRNALRGAMRGET